MNKYFIQHGYAGNSILWYYGGGWTLDILKAGRYTKEETKAMLRIPGTRAWEVFYVLKNMRKNKKTIYFQYLDSDKRVRL